MQKVAEDTGRVRWEQQDTEDQRQEAVEKPELSLAVPTHTQNMGQDQVKGDFLFFLLLTLRLQHQIAKLTSTPEFGQWTTTEQKVLTGHPSLGTAWGFLCPSSPSWQSCFGVRAGRKQGGFWKLSSVPQPRLQLLSVKRSWVPLKSVAVMMWAACLQQYRTHWGWKHTPDTAEINLRRTVYCPRWNSIN